VQLFPKDRLVVLVHFPFHWRPNGPLEKAYDDLILKNIFQRIRLRRESVGLNKPFEFALSPDAYQNFCHEVSDVHKKYRILSEIHLGSRVDWSHLVSGILFIDQFSIWDHLILPLAASRS
jgi:hypothetical protein